MAVYRRITQLTDTLRQKLIARGVDSPAPNNIFTPYRIQWLTMLGGRTSQDKIFADQSFWNRQYRRWLESGKRSAAR